MGEQAQLQPCPFCGAKAESEMNEAYGAWIVECENMECYAVAEVVGATQEEAEERWNIRTSATSEREARLAEAALVEMCEKIIQRFTLLKSVHSSTGLPVSLNVSKVREQFAAIRAEVLAALDTTADGGGEGVKAR